MLRLPFIQAGSSELAGYIYANFSGRVCGQMSAEHNPYSPAEGLAWANRGLLVNGQILYGTTTQ